MQQWEYRIVYPWGGKGNQWDWYESDQRIAERRTPGDLLDRLHDDGWELASTDRKMNFAVYTFKRPKP